MSRPIDLTGRTFGRLTVIARNERKDTNNTRSYWDCVCECGNHTVVHRSNLRSGRTQSCGCFQREIAVTQATVHCGTGSRLHRIWTGMHTRCCNKENPSYPNYGGRGIGICEEWLSFEPFREWALENGYSDDLTIDRIDVNGDYSPENCRWATRIEQANNTRKTVKVSWNGETKSLLEWSEIVGIPRSALWKRIHIRGWSVEKAFTTPLKNNGHIKIKEEK